jgi:hypothetical protein
MSWGPVLDDPTDGVQRRRVGYRASAALATAIGAGGEATVRAVASAHDLAPAWHAARFPLLAAVALAAAQLPRERRTPGPDEPARPRPRRSELARHLDRRARGRDAG